MAGVLTVGGLAVDEAHPARLVVKSNGVDGRCRVVVLAHRIDARPILADGEKRGIADIQRVECMGSSMVLVEIKGIDTTACAVGIGAHHHLDGGLCHAGSQLQE